jgi:anaerobic selenocysteine-containing dehydrogenase
MDLTRRTFIKGAGAAGAALAARQLLVGPETLRAQEVAQPFVEDAVPTACWIGKQDCGMIARRINGRVISLTGNPSNPRNLGTLCPKGVAQIAALYDPNRVKAPLVRTNGKGVPGTWRQATWDEALDLAAEQIRATREKDPSLVVWQKGRSKSKYVYDEALTEALECTKIGHGAFCSDAGYRALEYTMGPKGVLNPDMRHSRLILAWGWNAVAAGGNQLCWITWPRQLIEAKENGAKLITIDPRIRGTAHFSDRWLPIRPGTDLALALALCNVLIGRGTIDRDYLTTYTNAPYLVGEDGYLVRDGEAYLVWDEGAGRAVPAGTAGAVPALEGEHELGGRPVRPAFQVFVDHVASATPAWAAEITGIPETDIEALGIEIGEVASIGSTIAVDGLELPYRPVGVMAYHAMQQEMGFQASRAIITMLMLVGAMGAVGGTTGTTKWEVDDNYFALDAIEIGDGPYDFLLKSSRFFPINSGNPAVAATAILDPDTYGVGKSPEVMILHMANPVVSFPDTEVLKEAYAQLRFVVAISPWLSETADLFADVVLPAATLEKYEGPSSASDTYLDAVTVRTPPMAPLYQSRGETDIYLQLTERVGVYEAFVHHLNEHLELTGEFALDATQTYSEREVFDHWARQQGLEEGIGYFETYGVWVKDPLPASVRYGYATDPPFGGVVHRLYGEALLRYQEQMRDKGAPEAFWRDYTPLPTWRGLTMDASPPEYDLYLISYKLIEHKQDRTAFMPLLNELSGGQRVDLNPATAAARGIAQGQMVVVESHNAVTGETRQARAPANLTEAVRPDVVAMPHHFGLTSMANAKDLGPTSNALFFTGPGYVGQTADASFQVKARVYAA